MIQIRSEFRAMYPRRANALERRIGSAANGNSPGLQDLQSGIQNLRARRTKDWRGVDQQYERSSLPQNMARIAVVARMAVGTLLFLGLTAPMWMSFLVALENSYSLHSEVQVTQLPFVSLPGIFDDIFFLLPLKDDSFASVAPGTSLLVMAGCILSALRWRQLKGEPFFWVNASAILLWGGCVFGWVPATVLAAIPLLNRVGHVYTDFSYLLVIHLTIQSAYGFKCLAREVNFRRAAVDFLRVGLIFAGIILVYCIGITHRPIPWGYFLFVGAGAAGALLLFAFLRSRPGPIPALGWAGIIILGLVAQLPFRPLYLWQQGFADASRTEGGSECPEQGH